MDRFKENERSTSVLVKFFQLGWQTSPLWYVKVSGWLVKHMTLNIWLSFRRKVREGNGTPLQYSCLENLMDGGAWWAAVHGVATSLIWLSDFTFTFRLTGLILQSKELSSLLQHHNLKASILHHSAFFMVWLSHPYMTTRKTIALTIWTFVSKVMSLLFNMLSQFPEAFR